jgi:hypothetical protein
MRSSPKDTSVTGGSVKNAKYHIAIVRTVKQILSCESKHSQRLLIIATEPLKSGDHCRPVPPLLPELLPNGEPRNGRLLLIPMQMATSCASDHQKEGLGLAIPSGSGLSASQTLTPTTINMAPAFHMFSP